MDSLWLSPAISIRHIIGKKEQMGNINISETNTALFCLLSFSFLISETCSTALWIFKFEVYEEVNDEGKGKDWGGKREKIKKRTNEMEGRNEQTNDRMK